MKSIPGSEPIRKVSALVAILGVALSSAFAADVIKANTTTALNATGSWVGGVVPTANDVGVWDSTVTAANTVNLGANTNWLGIRIANPTGTVTITNTSLRLTLGASGIDLSGAASDLTLASGVGVNAAQSWNVTSGRTLTISGSLTGSTPVTKVGDGLAVLSVANTGYSGSLTLEQGTLRIGNASALGTAPQAFLYTTNTTADPTIQFGSGVTVTNVLVAQNLGFGAGASFRGADANGNDISGGLRFWINLQNRDIQVGGGSDRFSPVGGGISGTGNVSTYAVSGQGRITISGMTNTYTGATTIAGGTILQMDGSEQLPDGSDLTVNGNMYFNNNSTETVKSLSGAGNVQIHPGVVSASTLVLGANDGSGYFNGTVNRGGSSASAVMSLRKIGAGMQQLDAACGYNGPTHINAGTLALGFGGAINSTPLIRVAPGALFDVAFVNGGYRLLSGQTLTGAGAVNGPLTANPGAQVTPGADLVAGTLSFTNDLTFTTNVTLNCDLASTTTVGGGANDLLDVTGNVNFIGTNLVAFNFLNGSPAIGTPYTILKCSGTLTCDPATLVQNTRYTAVFDTSTVGELRVTFTGVVANLAWQGTNSVWDLGLTANWTNAAGVRDVFLAYDSVIFNDTASNYTANLTGNLRPASVVVDAGTNYTFGGSGKLSGPTGLSKTGTGTLTLGNTGGNEYLGPTAINGGVVRLGNATALPQNGQVTVTPGGAFDYAGTGTVTTRGYQFSIAGTGTNGAGAIMNTGVGVAGNASISNLTLTGNATVSATGGRWDIGTGGTNMLLQGNGYTLTKIGTQEINVRTHYVSNVAAMVINEGTLKHENFDRTNAATATTTNFVGPNSVLASYGNLTLNYPIVFRGGNLDNQSGTATWSGAMTLQSNATFNVANTINVLGALDGTGALTKAGGSTLTFEAPVSITGTSFVSAGVLKLGVASSLANSPSLTLNSGTTFNVTNLAGGFTLAGGQTLMGSGTVQGNVIAGTGTVVTPGLSVGTLTVNGSLGLTDGYSTFELAGSTNIGSSDYINVTNQLNLAGVTTLKIIPLTTLATTPYSLFRYATLSGGPANLNIISDSRYGWTVTTPANFVQVTPTGSAASLVWKGNSGTNPTWWDYKTTPNWLNGAVPDTFWLGDATRFDDTASSGTVSLQTPIIAGPVTFTNNSLDYALTGPGTLQVLNLAKLGAGKLTIANAVPNPISNIGLTNGTLVFNTPNDQAFSGVIAGTTGGTLEKDGGTTLTLTAANTYNRPTLVKAGTLQIGTGAAAGTLGSASPVTVQPGATLSFYRSDTYTINNPVTGSGTWLLRGTGVSGQSDYPLTGNNSGFTGPIVVDKARLQVDNGTSDLGGASGVTVLPGGQLWIAAAGPFALNKPLTLNGAGWVEGAGLLGAIRIQSGAILNGPITLGSNARICVRNTTGFLNGQITGPYELELDFGGQAGGTITLAPPVPNAFAATRLNNNFTAVAGNAGAFPSGPLAISGSTLRVNGFNFSFANLSGSGTINNNAATPCSLTLGSDNSSTTYTGVFSDSLPAPMRLTKVGSGILTLGGASSGLNGDLLVAGGTVLATVVNGPLGAYGTFGRQIVATNAGSTISFAINNVFGNTQTGEQNLPTINLYPGTLLTSTRYNSLGPIVLNNATINGIGDNASYQTFQLRGPVNAVGSAPSAITTSGGNNGLHLDSNTPFNVANVTGDSATDLIINAPLINRSADFAGIGGGAVAGFTKNGAGTLAINGVHTYSGPTYIAAGTLLLGSGSSIRNTSTITVDSGAVLATESAGGLTLNTNQVLAGKGAISGDVAAGENTRIAPGLTPFTAGTLTFVNNLSLTNTTLTLDIANAATIGGGVNDLLVVAGNLALDGTNQVSFNFLNGTPAFDVWYTLCTYNGTLIGGASNLVVLGVSAYTATFDDSVAGALRVKFSGSAPLALSWVGDAVSNYWDTGSALVWTNASTNALLPFAQYSPVRFDDNTFYPTITVTGTVSPASVFFTNDYTAYDFSGPGKITGSTALTKKGYGSLTLKVTNDFVGGSIISAGDVTIANNTGLGTGPITLGDLDSGAASISLLANYGNWAQSTKIANPITVSTNGSGSVAIGSTAFNPGAAYATIYTGPLVLDRPATLRSGNTDRTTFEGQISGSVGTLTIDGGARVTMGSPAFTNTFVGDVSVVGAATVFQFGHGANTYGDVIPDSSTVTVDAGAFFRINQGAETIKNLLGYGQLGFAGQNGVVTLAQGSGTFFGTINSTTLAKNGAGDYTLAGNADNGAGSATVNEGNLYLAKDSTASVHAIGSNLIINSNGVAILDGTGGDQLYLGADVQINGNGVLNVNGWSDGFDILSGSGGVLLNNSATAALVTIGQGNGSGAYFGQVRDGVGRVSLTKEGSGTITLAGSLDNAYTGLTIVQNGTLEFGKTGGAKAIMPGLTIQMGAGTANQPNLRMNADNQFATGVLMTFTNTANNWARFDLQGTTQYVAGVSSPVDALRGAVIQNERQSGGFSSADSMLVISNLTDYAYWGYFRDEDDGGTIYKLGLTKRGPAAQTLIGANVTHTGPTRVEQGTLILNTTTAWRSPTFVAGGTTLLWTNTGNWGSGAGGTVSGSGTWNVVGSGTSGQGHYDVNNDMSAFTGPLTISNARYQADADTELPSGTIVVNPGGQIWAASAGTYTRNVTLGGNGWVEGAGSLGAFRFTGGANWAGTITMTANSRFTPYGAGDSGTISGVIQGPYGIEKTGSGTLTLAGANTYSGPTVFAAGTTVIASSGSFNNSPVIDVRSGSILNVSAFTPGFTINAGQTFMGNGTNIGSIIIASGATFSPGASIGGMTITTNLTLAAGSTNLFEIAKGSTPSNDVVSAASIVFGGTLKMAHLGSPVAAGDRFKLFNAGSYSGSFAVVEPAIPGTGLAWDTSELATSGTLKVVSSVNTTPINIGYSVTSTNLVLSWPADHIGWRLQSQTNAISTGITTTWYDVAGSTATNQMTFPVSPAEPTVFYRLVYP